MGEGEEKLKGAALLAKRCKKAKELKIKPPFAASALELLITLLEGRGTYGGAL